MEAGKGPDAGIEGATVTESQTTGESEELLKGAKRPHRSTGEVRVLEFKEGESRTAEGQ